MPCTASRTLAGHVSPGLEGHQRLQTQSMDDATKNKHQVCLLARIFEGIECAVLLDGVWCVDFHCRMRVISTETTEVMRKWKSTHRLATGLVLGLGVIYQQQMDVLHVTCSTGCGMLTHTRRA